MQQPAPHVTSGLWQPVVPVHTPPLQVGPPVAAVHWMHELPPEPHATAALPSSHVAPSQHPAHDAGPHSQTPSLQDWPVAHDPVAHVPPQPSSAPHAPVHDGTQSQAPVSPQVAAQTAQVVPPCPHADGSVPSSHVLPVQHPEHDVGPHAQTPPLQNWPTSHDASTPVHTPPQPSPPPHTCPSHVGVHPHSPVTPAPPQESGELHVVPSQQGCPFPPQVPHVVPHVVPAAHTVHALPPAPQAEPSVPGSHVLPLQQPAQEVVSHVHDPAAQCWPVAQLPCSQNPSQPLLAPHT